MSSFLVQAYPLSISVHPKADRLDLARVGGYVSVVRRDEFADGDVAIYIPEAALVPDTLLAELGLWNAETGKGMLAGRDGRLVKAVRLRNVLSQGLVFRPGPDSAWAHLLPLQAGVDYAEALGVEKHRAEIPAELLGKVEQVDGLRTYTDLENIKRYPDVLADGEPVLMTEKLHGVCTVAGLLTESDTFVVSSKGNAHKGLAILEGDGPYWRMAREYRLEHVVRSVAAGFPDAAEVTLFGETIGVQDLKYGLSDGALDFRAFDLRVDGEYLPYEQFLRLMAEHDLPTVAVVYQGPFSAEALHEHTTGPSTLGGKGHVREGVVVRPALERRDESVGRVVLKSINDKYLIRKGETTEFE